MGAGQVRNLLDVVRPQRQPTDDRRRGRMRTFGESTLSRGWVQPTLSRPTTVIRHPSYGQARVVKL